MRRRDFITAIGGAATWTHLAKAQQRRPRKIGYLYAGSLDENTDIVDAFRNGLANMGFVEGRNAIIEFRAAHHDRTLLPKLARDLVDRQVDVIVVPGSTPAALAAKAATATIPIVFNNAGDPIKAGLVASLSHPGANVTGIMDLGNALSAKRLEFIKLLAPGASLIALLVTPNTESLREIGNAREGARALGFDILALPASTAEDIDGAFATLAQKRVDGVCVSPTALFFDHQTQIVALAARHRVPAAYPFIQFVLTGGLMSYGSNLTERNYQAGQIHRTYPERQESCRSSHPPARKLRARDQHADREDPGPDGSGVVYRARRQGHRMSGKRVRRRDVLAVLGGVAAWPQRAHAQQGRLPTIGYLYEGPLAADSPALIAFRAGLAETGYLEGRNVAMVIRAANNDRMLLPQLARELVRFPVDIIVAPGSGKAILAASAATATIPIVFGNAGDWTNSPLVASLHRPGGNVTGISDFSNTLSAKRMEFLKLLVPGASVIAALVTAGNPQAERDLASARESIRALGAEVFVSRADTAEEIDAAFATFAHSRAEGLCVTPSMLFVRRSAQIVGLAAHHRLPAVYPFIRFAQIGGLISYGSDLNERNRQTGIYAGLILNGAKPADLPVRRLENFELAINMTTANALGLAVPASFLALADKVIE